MWPIVTLIPMKYALPLKFLQVTAAMICTAGAYKIDFTEEACHYWQNYG